MLYDYRMLSFIERNSVQFNSKEQSQDKYFVGRLFFDRKNVNGYELDSVNEALPFLDGESASWWLSKKYSDNHQMRLLDIGCGDGNALLDIKNRFPEVHVVGITKADIQPYLVKGGKRIVGGIEYIQLQRNTFDFVYSAYALTYSEQHMLNTFRNVYDSLKVGGVGFLQMKAYYEWKTRVKNFDRLDQDMKQLGIHVNFDEPYAISNSELIGVSGISFLKSSSTLPNLSNYIPEAS